MKILKRKKSLKHCYQIVRIVYGLRPSKQFKNVNFVLKQYLLEKTKGIKNIIFQAFLRGKFATV